MYVCYSRSKNESHAKAVLYHLESWGFTMPEEDGEKNIMSKGKSPSDFAAIVTSPYSEEAFSRALPAQKAPTKWGAGRACEA